MTGLWGHVLPAALAVVVTPLTANTSNSCKNLVELAPPQPALKQALDLTTTPALVAEETQHGPGSVVRLAVLPPGALGTQTGTMRAVAVAHPLAHQGVLRLGLVIGVTVTVEVVAVTTEKEEIVTTAAETLTEVVPRPVLLPGAKVLRRRLPTRVLTQGTALMALLRVWALHRRQVCRRRLPLERRLDFLVDLMRSSNSMLAVRLLHHLLLEKRHRLRRLWMPLLHLLLEPNRCQGRASSWTWVRY